jgi:hypothetical protein
MRQVSDLSQDPAALERLVASCLESAALEWEELRAERLPVEVEPSEEPL